MRPFPIRYPARVARWAGLGLVVLLVGMSAGADDPPLSDNLKLQREVEGKLAGLRKETEILRAVLERREAEIKCLEAVQVQLMVSEFRERAERHYREDMRKDRFREELRRSREPDFTVRKL